MTPDTEHPVSRLIKGLGQRYLQHVNRAYGRTGTFFDRGQGLPSDL